MDTEAQTCISLVPLCIMLRELFNIVWILFADGFAPFNPMCRSEIRNFYAIFCFSFLFAFLTSQYLFGYLFGMLRLHRSKSFEYINQVVHIGNFFQHISTYGTEVLFNLVFDHPNPHALQKEKHKIYAIDYDFEIANTHTRSIHLIWCACFIVIIPFIYHNFSCHSSLCPLHHIHYSLPLSLHIQMASHVVNFVLQTRCAYISIYTFAPSFPFRLILSHASLLLFDFLLFFCFAEMRMR